jgi:hypothetical protein
MNKSNMLRIEMAFVFCPDTSKWAPQEPQWQHAILVKFLADAVLNHQKWFGLGFGFKVNALERELNFYHARVLLVGPCIWHIGKTGGQSTV